MKNKIVFLHLPKTGGTSLHQIINKSIGEEKMFPERFNRLYLYSREEMEKFTFFSGHYDWQGVTLIPGNKNIITLLREPKKRILSLYYFWKSHTWDHIGRHRLNDARVAKENNLLDFLRFKSKGVICSIDNAIVRNLIGGKLVASNEKRLCELPVDALVSHSMANLESMKAFGILEEMDASIKLIMRELRLNWNGVIPHEYNSKNYQTYPYIEEVEKEEITPEINEEIEKLTQIDNIIYSNAIEIFHNRLAKENK